DPNGPVQTDAMPVWQRSSIVTAFQLAAMLQPSEIGPNSSHQPRGFRELLFQLRCQPRHLVLEWLTIIFDVFGTNVPTRCQHAAVRGDLFRGRRLAESRHVLILARTLIAAACVVGSGDAHHAWRGDK